MNLIILNEIKKQLNKYIYLQKIVGNLELNYDQLSYYNKTKI